MKAKIQNIRTKSRRNKIPAAEIQGTPARQIHKELIWKEQPPQFQEQLWVFSCLEFQCFTSVEFFQFFFWYQTEKGKIPNERTEIEIKCFSLLDAGARPPRCVEYFFFCASPVHFRTWGGETSAFLGKIYLKLCSMGDVPCK